MSYKRPEIEDLLHLAERKVAEEDFFSSSFDEVKFTVYRPDEKTFVINKNHIRIHTRSGAIGFAIKLTSSENERASLIVDSALQSKESKNLKRLKDILEGIEAADEKEKIHI